jgi:hypothetical protein
MFLQACRAVAKEYPDVAYDEDLLDRTCLRVRFTISLFSAHGYPLSLLLIDHPC